MSVTWRKHDKHVVHAAASHNFISVPKCTSVSFLFPSLCSSRARMRAEKASAEMKEMESRRE